jgi:hypothetical protein
MKYVKITVMLFAVSLLLGMAGVDAAEYTQLVNVKIPAFSNMFISQQVDKDDDWQYTQKVKQLSVSDDWSGDGRRLEASLQGVFTGMITTSWRELNQGYNVEFGTGTEVQGGWRLRVRSIKWLPTTATASFDWDLGTILSSPYPIYGSRD